MTRKTSLGKGQTNIPSDYRHLSSQLISAMTAWRQPFIC